MKDEVYTSNITYEDVLCYELLVELDRMFGIKTEPFSEVVKNKKVVILD